MTTLAIVGLKHLLASAASKPAPLTSGHRLFEFTLEHCDTGSPLVDRADGHGAVQEALSAGLLQIKRALVSSFDVCKHHPKS